jgi:hypothetical protein
VLGKLPCLSNELRFWARSNSGFDSNANKAAALDAVEESGRLNPGGPEQKK